MLTIPRLVFSLLIIGLSLQFNFGQTNQNYAVDPMSTIAVEVARVSQNVEQLTAQLKAFVDKFEKVGGISFNDKQQRLVLGMELLVRAEQRIAEWQKYQIELVQKQGETRAKLSAIEVELRPERIDRSLQFEGTTRTEELRESRRALLAAERQSLSLLMNQIEISLSEANATLRESQALANRLRRTFVPQIEQELFQ